MMALTAMDKLLFWLGYPAQKVLDRTNQTSALGYFVRGRYSHCGIDDWRNVLLLVSQKL
jgi:hypothetical protein